MTDNNKDRGEDIIQGEQKFDTEQSKPAGGVQRRGILKGILGGSGVLVGSPFLSETVSAGSVEGTVTCAVTETAGQPTLTDYPALVRIESGDTKKTGTGPIEIDDSSVDSESDIGIFDASGNALPYSWVRFEPSNGVYEAWVRGDFNRDGTDQLEIRYGSDVGGSEVSMSKVFGDVPDLLLRYGFEESSGPAQDDADGRSGQLFGPTPGVDSPILSKGYSFDGVDDYLVIEDAIPRLDNDFTIESWLVPNLSQKAKIIQLGENNNTFLNVKPDNNEMQFVIDFGNDVADSFQRASKTELESDQPYHAVGRWDKGQGLDFVLDGQERESTAISDDDMYIQGSRDAIGRDASSPNAYFKGLCSEMRVYDGYVSDAWLKADYDITSKAGYGFFSQTSGSQENKVPTASFTISPNRPKTSQNVTLDASSSTDPDGTISTFEWDLDDDGSFERTGQTVDYKFNIPGQKTITLQVTDDSGATAISSREITVPLRYAPEKKSIASNIDDISITPLNDKVRADSTINNLSTAVQQGDLGIQTAEDTVERLKLGESVVEVVLAKVKALVESLVRPILTTAMELAVGVYGFTRASLSSADFLSLGGAGEFLAETANELAKDNLFVFLDWFFGEIQDQKRDAKVGIKREADSIIAQLIDEGDVTQKKIENLIKAAVDTILDGIAAGLRVFFETGIRTPVPGVQVSTGSADTLDYLFENLNLDAANIGLSGTQQGARIAEENKIDEIINQTQLVRNDIETVKEFKEEADLISVIADIFDEDETDRQDVFEALVAAVETLFGSVTSAINVGMGLQGLIELQIQQAIASYLIINGRDSL